jgi:hypothetical protein
VTKKKIPQRALIPAIVAGFLFVAMLGYFLVISPQRSEVASLQKEIDQTDSQIANARALSAQRRHTPKIRVAEVYKLTKAMPDQADVPGIILELNETAAESGITFDSITPQTATPLSGYQAIPIQVVFDGNYYALSDFLYRLRNLVDVHRGVLDATGRLFAIDTIAFDEGQLRFPQIRATMTIDAFVYGTSSPATTAAPLPATTTGTSTTTTGTSTTPTGTTTTPGSTTPTTTTTTATTPAAPTPGSTAAPATPTGGTG